MLNPVDDHADTDSLASGRSLRQAPEVAAAERLSRRGFLCGVGGAAAAAALSACGSRSSRGSSGNSGSKVQLVYQDWRTEWFPPMAREMLDRFEESHPHIRVYYTADPVDVETEMLADMAAGTAPDVFQGCCTHFPTWAQAGYCLDLGPYVWEDLEQSVIDDWDPAQYNALRTPDGLQFGLPKYHGALALYYNKDVFDALALGYPNGDWTHDDYADAMRRVMAGLDVEEGSVWGSMFDPSWDRVQVHVNAWGGHFVDPSDPSICMMCEPEAMAAMEWLRARMWDDRCMASSLDVDNLGTAAAFAAGKLAMVEDGSWSLRTILEGAGFRIGVAPLPAGPARRATLATTDGFGIYAGTRHPDAAWELLKFLISKDYGRAMAKASLLQPARRSLVQEWIDVVRGEFPAAANGIDLAVFAAGQAEGYSVTAEIFSRMSGVREWAKAAWQRIYTLGEAPVSEMESVCQQIRQAQLEP